MSYNKISGRKEEDLLSKELKVRKFSFTEIMFYHITVS